MQGFKVFRVIAAIAVVMTTACGDNYVPTAPSFPPGVGLAQPDTTAAQPARDTMPVKPPPVKPPVNPPVRKGHDQ